MSELDAFDYALPPERIAQSPVEPRDAARLLRLDRSSDARTHHHVRDLPELLRPGDLLVVNATRVLPARLRGHKETGGAAEALLLGPAAAMATGRLATTATGRLATTATGRLATTATGPRLRALVRARGRLHVGQKLRLGSLDAEIVELAEHGEVTLAFPPGAEPYAGGETPLPPYIRRPAARPEDADRYQTVFAREPGSVAAPTAGLHLTPELLARLSAAGVGYAEVILHVGPGTFRPIREADLAAGALHPEPFELPEDTALAVARTHEAGGRVVAVGTTVTRVLEHAARGPGRVAPGSGETRLFLRPDASGDPGRSFQVVDVLLTNFHLPRSSLLLLVAAFAGRERVLDAYAEAVHEGYRFYSYGDAMLIQ